MRFNAPQSDRKRCAIYTRKSTEHGLEQDFNSIEAQRALCSAYITSQRHKGWAELAKHFDDGGESGASLDRPQLQELLADIEAGIVQVVVVYKLDRMTRTLLDFVRLMDFFERYEVVFVSITQNFDTADSMGRLILNVLLTFAQFEREMLSDRLKDKIRATKQSGRWAGGPAPFGYDLIRRRLHVNEAEAEAVRFIYATYLEQKNLTAAYRLCRDKDMRSKRWRTRAGRWWGGGAITKAGVNHILGNPVYLGEIRHGDEAYQGLHAPIIDRTMWNQVQAIRAERANTKAGRNKENVLTDLIFDCFGRPMSVSFTASTRQDSRFYVSRQSAWGKRQHLKPLRANAAATEKLVTAALSSFLRDRAQIRSLLLEQELHSSVDRISRKCAAAAQRVANADTGRLRLILRALVERVELTLDRVKIVVRCSEIVRFLEWDGVGLFKGQRADWKRSRTKLLDIPAATLRRRRMLHMPIAPRPAVALSHPAPGLKRLVKEARALQQLVDSERHKTLEELAAQVDYTPARFARVLRVNYLAPDIILAIIDGTSPPNLTRRKLIQSHIPMDWSLQRQLFGFAERPQLESGN